MTASAAEREEFAASVGRAVRDRSGFAAGKLGGTEQAWMLLTELISEETDPRRVRAFAVAMGNVSVRHAGVFPADDAFQREFAARFAADVAQLDSIGVTDDVVHAKRIVRYHGLPITPVHYSAHEPDRSAPADDGSCWLYHLHGARILLVCPFAHLLAERATREEFEAVWAKTGKRWFEPAHVSAVELPYGFDPETQERYANSLDLLDDICERMDAIEYDVALIAVAGLGIPIAVHAKREGRVGISLGGHLQVLFGVLGERWRERRKWQRLYFNDSWIDMPERYRPDPALTDGDYW